MLQGRDPPKALRPARKRQLVDRVRGEWGVSIRRACRVLEVDTSTYHDKSRRPEQVGLEACIREICATRVRYGSRRVHVLLGREGWRINSKKTNSIPGEALQVYPSPTRHPTAYVLISASLPLRRSRGTSPLRGDWKADERYVEAVRVDDTRVLSQTCRRCLGLIVLRGVILTSSVSANGTPSPRPLALGGRLSEERTSAEAGRSWAQH